MKKIFNKVLLFAVMASMILTALVSCANKPETAEECAEEYVKAVLAYDFEKVLNLTAGIGYDGLVDIVASGIKMSCDEEPAYAKAIGDYYKTDDYEEIVKDAISRLKDKPKDIDVANAEVSVLNSTTVVGEELLEGVAEFNQEIEDTFEEADDMDLGFKASDFIIDPNSVSEVKVFDVRVAESEVEVYVAKIDGEWAIMDPGFNILGSISTMVLEEVLAGPLAELGLE